MKIIAGIACVPLNKEMRTMTASCITAFAPLVDWTILVQNGQYGVGTPELDADVKIINKINRLHAGAINQIALLSKPDDFIAFINDDITPRGSWDRADMESLCVPDAIVSPQIAEQDHSYGAHASFFVLQRKLFDSIGFWKLSGHKADVDFFDRAKAKGVQMLRNAALVVNHDHPAATISKILAPPTYMLDDY